MMDTVIETQDLVCRFGSFTAVDRLNLSIPRGTIYGFIGSNGSGKSTTIRMLCGLLRPTSGRALVLGCDTAREPEKVKAAIGYMSQKFSLYHDLTTLENLNFYAGLYGLPRRERAERIKNVLALLRLGTRTGQLAGQMSGGQRQRLALGCAILHRPEVIILDEPTSAVDPSSRRLFWNLLAELAADGRTTILVTTHFMDEAEHCGMVGFLKDGRLTAQGSPHELKASLPARLYRLSYPTHDEARRALHLLMAPEDILDAYAYGAAFHALLAPTARIPAALKCESAPLSMEDVFIYYDKAKGGSRE